MREPWHQKTRSLLAVAAGIFISSLMGWGYWIFILWFFGFFFIVSALILHAKKPSRMMTILNRLGLTFLLAVTFVRVVLINQERSLTYECQWSDSPESGTLQPKTVELTPISYPNHYDGIYSKDLSEFLRSLGREKVLVEYDVVYDFFQVRGYSIESVAGRELCPMRTSCPAGTIRTNGGYGGTRGNGSNNSKNGVFEFFN